MGIDTRHADGRSPVMVQLVDGAVEALAVQETVRVVEEDFFHEYEQKLIAKTRTSENVNKIA